MLAHSAPLLSLLMFAAPAADGWLGVYLASDREEAVVVEVIPGSPAQKAGLQAGDVLLAVGDQATPTREQFIAAIRAGKVGDRVRLKVRRQDQESIVVVKLGERPESVEVPAEPSPARGERPKPDAGPAPTPKAAPVPKAAPAPQAPPERRDGAAAPRRGYLGLSVRETEQGVAIDRVLPDGPAAAAGIAEGWVIQSIGERPVHQLADLDRILGSSGPGRKIALGLRTPDGVRSVPVVLAEGPATVEAPRDVAVGRPLRASDAAPAPATARRPAATEPADLEAELAALRAELKELRRQLEELRKARRE